MDLVAARKSIDEMEFTGATISSRDIAVGTGKNHFHICRDIRHMFAELKLDPEEYAGTYLDKSNRKSPMFNLTEEHALLLMTGYSVQLRAAVIMRLHDLETGKVQPKYLNQLTPMQQIVAEAERMIKLEQASK